MGEIMATVQVDRPCKGRGCDRRATVYAVDPYPDGWGDWYCQGCTPSSWLVLDRVECSDGDQ